MDFPDDDSGRASVLSFAGASAGSSVRSLTQIFVDRSGGLEPLMGFEQVYPAEGTVSFEPVADIIFVTGFGNNYTHSWQGPPFGSRQTLWPRDALPREFPDFRVLLFQYVTDVGGEYDTEVLLRRLLDFRRQTPETLHRPLIFIGLGLGGVTIQKMLLRARKEKGAEFLWEATRGTLVFMAPNILKPFSVPGWSSYNNSVKYYDYWNGEQMDYLDQLTLNSLPSESIAFQKFDGRTNPSTRYSDIIAEMRLFESLSLVAFPSIFMLDKSQRPPTKIPTPKLGYLDSRGNNRFRELEGNYGDIEKHPSSGRDDLPKDLLFVFDSIEIIVKNMFPDWRKPKRKNTKQTTVAATVSTAAAVKKTEAAEKLCFPAAKPRKNAPAGQPLSVVQASTMRSLMPMASTLHLCISADVALGNAYSAGVGTAERKPSPRVMTPSGEWGTRRSEKDDGSEVDGSESSSISKAQRAKQMYRLAHTKFRR